MAFEDVIVASGRNGKARTFSAPRRLGGVASCTAFAASLGRRGNPARIKPAVAIQNPAEHEVTQTNLLLTPGHFSHEKNSMHNDPQGFSVRLRHYVTLITQIVPLIAIVLNLISETQSAKILVLVCPLILGSVGPILELSGKRTGRYLTLTGLGLEFLIVIAAVITFFFMARGAGEFKSRDLLPLLLVLLFALGPGLLFVWNLRAGRQTTSVAASQP